MNNSTPAVEMGVVIKHAVLNIAKELSVYPYTLFSLKLRKKYEKQFINYKCI
jgi:hypothetical protein